MLFKHHQTERNSVIAINVVGKQACNNYKLFFSLLTTVTNWKPVVSLSLPVWLYITNV